MNSFLSVSTIMSWISNALVYAVLICLFGYLTFHDSMVSWDLYGVGTAVYTAMCMALQMKVSFLAHQWNRVNVIIMLISVGGMLLWFYILNASYEYNPEYYMEANFLYKEVVYWFYCFFSIAIFTALLDFNVHSVNLFFNPSLEMLFRECELEVS